MTSITEDDVRVLTHELTATLGDGGHTFCIAISRQGGNFFLGGAVVDHVLPGGKKCAHDTHHLVAMHKNFEIMIMGAIDIHLQMCKSKWKKKSTLRIVHKP